MYTAGTRIIEQKLRSQKIRLKTIPSTPPDPDSARIRILFYNYFFSSIISGADMISTITHIPWIPETGIIERFTQN